VKRLEVEHFSIADAAPAPQTLPEPGVMTLDQIERAMIAKSMEHYGGNISRVAEALGLSRAALYRRLEKYGMPAGER
jgi:DNA-binding NtrC family response regulator